MRELLLTDSTLQQLATDLQNQISAVEGFTTTFQFTAAGQVAELQAFIGLLTATSTVLAGAQTTTESLSTTIQTSSASPAPYFFQSQTLAENLLEAQTSTIELLVEVASGAGEGITDVNEIVADINLLIFNINHAPFGTVGEAILEARAELAEIVPDAASDLGEIVAGFTEASTELAPIIFAIRADLGTIPSPTPAFNDFINQFIAGTVVVTPGPTPPPGTGPTLTPVLPTGGN